MTKEEFEKISDYICSEADPCRACTYHEKACTNCLARLLSDVPVPPEVHQLEKQLEMIHDAKQNLIDAFADLKKGFDEALSSAFSPETAEKNTSKKVKIKRRKKS